ncbi:MAG TPA: VWA domain-containing protein [Verrucomicrobiae bacterium]|nr:VWA domain-containing protein [Verrucomicrobiae bacterium]
MSFRVLGLFAGLVLAVPLAAQSPQQGSDAPLPVIRTETRVVLVDAVVTDKKGGYISDLAQKDFKVYEDGKEQAIKSFSFEADPNSPVANQKHYMMLLFDNSHMDSAGQMRAREAAIKFVDANGGPNRLMAVANYSGALEITQNFTQDVDRLKQVINGVRFNMGPTYGNFGTRNSMLALSTLAKNLQDVPGRKILILLTGGFRVTEELLPDITAAISMCNHSNVAIYPIDVGGLSTGMPDLSNPGGGRGRGIGGGRGGGGVPLGFNPLGGILGSSGIMSASFQARGGGGGSTGGGSTGGGSTGGGSTGGSSGGGIGRSSSGSGGAGGGSTGGGSTGGFNGGRAGGGTNSGGFGNTGGATGSRGGTGATGVNGGRGGTVGGGGAAPVNPNNPMGGMNRNAGIIRPPLPPFASENQQALYMLADGTGGFVIVNTNDLIGGMEKILKEQDQFYLISYAPPESAEGSCHSLKVKVDRGGTTVRARTGYCNVKPVDLLSGKPVEKTMEGLAGSTQAGSIQAPLQLPYFFTGPDTARVNVAFEFPSEAMKFTKVKGKEHSELNILGMAVKSDGSVAARFSDTVKLDLEDKKAIEEFRKKPMHYDTQFDLGSGDYTFKLVYAPTGSQDFGKVERPLKIETFDGKQFAMSAVALSTDLAKVTDADSGLDALLTEGRTPLVAGGFKLTPTGQSHFPAGQKVFLYMEVYEPAETSDKPPELGIKLEFFDTKTNQLKDQGGAPVTKYAIPGNPMVPVPLVIPSTLPAGSYRCQFTAMDNLGHTAVRNLEFSLQ